MKLYTVLDLGRGHSVNSIKKSEGLESSEMLGSIHAPGA